MEKQYPKVEPFKDHQNCSGHANYMLDCTYEKIEERNALVKTINNYVKEE